MARVGPAALVHGRSGGRAGAARDAWRYGPGVATVDQRRARPGHAVRRRVQGFHGPGQERIVLRARSATVCRNAWIPAVDTRRLARRPRTRIAVVRHESRPHDRPVRDRASSRHERRSDRELSYRCRADRAQDQTVSDEHGYRAARHAGARGPEELPVGESTARAHRAHRQDRWNDRVGGYRARPGRPCVPGAGPGAPCRCGLSRSPEP